MKLLLLQPKFPTHIITPPLGLGYLASYCQSQGHQVTLWDCLAKRWSAKTVISQLAKTQFDLIGISVLTISFSEVTKLVKAIKRHYPTIPIVLGGPHVSALPKLTLTKTEADYAVLGEGEVTLAKLLKCLAKPKAIHKLAGLAYKTPTGQIVVNKPRPLVKNINTLPFPAWELLQPQHYPPAPHGAFFRAFPTVPITTSRGCPYQCSFCASAVTWQHRIRFRNAQNVVDEIELLVTKFGIKEFHFEDDNFTVNKQHASAICRELLKRKLNIVWACPNGVRINCLDKELLVLMKQSGCYLLAFGIESGSQTILNKANKHLQVKDVRPILQTAKAAGIQTWGFFIIGLPGETPKTAEATIAFARSLPLDRAQFCKFAPLPGTAIYNHWIKTQSGNPDWNKFSFFGNSLYSTRSMSTKQLNYYQKKAFRAFYLRPKTLLRFLLMVKPRQLKWLFIRLFDYFTFFFR